ncbi:hypothetical protein LCGC14_1628990, partial [marine sediment metagenome]
MKEELTFKKKAFYVMLGMYYMTLIFGVYTFYNYDFTERIFYQENAFTDANPSEDCNNLSLVDTSYCLRGKVKEIFSFNYTDDDLTLTYDELKTRGGDCKDWSDYYKSITPNNYYSRTTTFDFAEGYAHR